jgi:hypothetical protein
MDSKYKGVEGTDIPVAVTDETLKNPLLKKRNSKEFPVPSTGCVIISHTKPLPSLTFFSIRVSIIPVARLVHVSVTSPLPTTDPLRSIGGKIVALVSRRGGALRIDKICPKKRLPRKPRPPRVPPATEAIIFWA